MRWAENIAPVCVGSETIARLALEEGRSVRLLDVARSLAYVRTRPYLSQVVLAEGVLDLERNLPAREVGLVRT